MRLYADPSKTTVMRNLPDLLEESFGDVIGPHHDRMALHP